MSCEAKITEDKITEAAEEEQYRSISFDQQYVFDRLPLSQEQKHRLIQVLASEQAEKKQDK